MYITDERPQAEIEVGAITVTPTPYTIGTKNKIQLKLDANGSGTYPGPHYDATVENVALSGTVTVTYKGNDTILKPGDKWQEEYATNEVEKRLDLIDDFIVTVDANAQATVEYSGPA